MFKVKFKKYNKVTKKPCIKILLLTLLLFVFSEVPAKSPHFNNLISQIADTVPKKVVFSNGTGIGLNPFPPKTACDPDFFASVYGANVGDYTFTSSNTDVATINARTGEIHILQPGNTNIIVRDPNSTPPSQAERVLIISAPITPSVTISPLNYPISCLGTFVTYTATVVNGGVNPSYAWYANGIFISSPFTNVLRLSTLPSGAIITCVVTDNSDPCVTSRTATSNAATLTVYPYTTPGVTITQSPNGAVKSGTAITFTAIPSLSPADNAPYSLSYQWNLNGNPIPNAINPTYTSPCSHNDDYFTCTVTPTGVPCLAYGAVTSADQRVTITDENVPINAEITVSANSVYAGTDITFRATLSGNANVVSYLWQINGIDTNVYTSELKTFALKNNDEVRCVIFTNDGCMPVAISDPIKMIIYPTPDVVIPNTFTPNGDGINDVWEVKYLYLYRNNTVRIFNRYGSMLYHSKGYNTPWDGTYNGKAVPVGTYYYVIDLGIHRPNLSGALNVIR